MAQILKEDIKKRIDAAALKNFSEKGFQSTSMSDIARDASISVGNIYHYYARKEVLFYSLISPELVNRFKALLMSKYRMADGLEMKEVRHYGPMNLRDAEMREFLFRYRLHMVILLSRAEGTRYAGFKGELVDFMMSNVNAYLDTMRVKSEIELNTLTRHVLRIVYENLLNAFIEIFLNYKTEKKIAESYEHLMDYHYLGVSKLLE